MANESKLKQRSKPFLLGLILGFSITSIGAVYAALALLHKLRFRHKLPLPDNELKDTLSDWRTQMSETV